MSGVKKMRVAPGLMTTDDIKKGVNLERVAYLMNGTKSRDMEIPIELVNIFKPRSYAQEASPGGGQVKIGGV